MKKAVCLIVICLLMISVVACTNGKNGEAKNPTGTVTGNPTPSGEVLQGADLFHVCGGEVTVADYSVLKAPAEMKALTDEDIEKEFNAQINSVLEQYPNYIHDESRDGTEVKDGDTVNIDYLGKLEGVPFEGGADNGFDLTIGSGTFIGDFEAGLIGKKVGTTVDIETKFPDTYQNNPDLAGKTTVFTVTINYVGLKKDEADDAYINRISKGTYKTLAEYRELLKEDMELELKNTYEENLYADVLKQMVDGSTFTKILDEDIAFYEKDMVNYYTMLGSQYGMEFAEVASVCGFDTEEAFRANIHDEASEYVKEYMVLQSIVANENINLSEEEYGKRVLGYMGVEEAGEEEVASFEKEYSKEYLEYCIKNDLALELLVEKAKKN